MLLQPMFVVQSQQSQLVLLLLLYMCSALGQVVVF
jgi:hypothetical protein